MRKTIFMGLGLAATLAGVAAAQHANAPRRDRSEQAGGQGGQYEGRGGRGGLLLKNITLTDAQKTQLQALRKAREGTGNANREQMKKQFDEARAARQRGDTATARAIMDRNRQAMEQERSQQIAAMRNILTPDQRVQFDKNVTEMKQRSQDRAQRGSRSGNGSRRGGSQG